MASLVCDGRVVAPLEVASSHRERLRGLLGRDALDGALYIEHTNSVHTLGMRFDLDVAFCDSGLRVIAVKTMKRHRVGLPRFKAHSVLEAAAGAFEQWNLHVGSRLEVKP